MVFTCFWRDNEKRCISWMKLSFLVISIDSPVDCQIFMEVADNGCAHTCPLLWNSQSVTVIKINWPTWNWHCRSVCVCVYLCVRAKSPLCLNRRSLFLPRICLFARMWHTQALCARVHVHHPLWCAVDLVALCVGSVKVGQSWICLAVSS